MGLRISSLIDCRLCANLKDNICVCESLDAQRLYRSKGKDAASECDEFINERVPLSGEVKIEVALRFILAGKSEFILKSGKTGTEIKYKLDRRIKSNDSCDKENDDWFYWVNTAYKDDPMIYAGVIFFDFNDDQFKFSRGARGNLSTSDIRIKSILYVLNHLFNGDISINVKVMSYGKCGRCGKRLEDAESMKIGLSKKCLAESRIPQRKESKGKDVKSGFKPEELFGRHIPDAPVIKNNIESDELLEMITPVSNRDNIGLERDNIEDEIEDEIEDVFGAYSGSSDDSDGLDD